MRENDVVCQASTAAPRGSAASAPRSRCIFQSCGVAAFLRQQFLVGAALDDAAVLEHEDLVGIDDRRQPVRDDQRGALARDLGELGLDDLLGARVERDGRLVEDQDGRVLEQRARDRDALLFAAGELEAALADHRVVAVRQRFDEGVDVRGARRGDDLLARRLGPAVGDVVVDRVVEQHGVLRNDADRARAAIPA